MHSHDSLEEVQYLHLEIEKYRLGKYHLGITNPQILNNNNNYVKKKKGHDCELLIQRLSSVSVLLQASHRNLYSHRDVH